MILITSKGEHFETSLTDQEAIETLKGLKSQFAQSLYLQASKGLSNSQIVWAHKLAMDAIKPKPQIDLANLRLLLQTAAKSLAYPKIRLQLDQNQIVLSLKEDGTITITDKNEQDYNSFAGRFLPRYYGKIDHNNTFHSGHALNGLVALLNEMSANPVQTAQAYGRMTGNCSFCGKGLTDERSITVGYGPICADKYCLPWG